MILYHICEPWKYGNSVEVECHQWKFNWKKLKWIPVFEIYFVKRCFICGKVISKTPMPEQKGWASTLDMRKRSGH